MRPEHLARAKEVVVAALALPADRRATYLDQTCGDDPELRAEVASLLAQDANMPRVLATAEAMRDALKPFGAAETRRAAPDMLDTTSNLFDGLAALAGAKTVVLISGGFGMGREVEGSVRKVVSRGVRAGARVYAIDPLGLQRVGGPPDLLNSLSVDTGGLVIFHENNFGRALDAIAADTGVYYLLGVRPLNRKFDGKYARSTCV